MTTDLNALRAGAATPTVEGPPKFTFQNPGDEVYGQVDLVRFDVETKFGAANLIEVSDVQRGPVTVWLSNVQLETGLVQGRNQLGRPVQQGDTVYIRFDSTEAREGGKTLKHFAINLAPGEQAPQQAPQPQYQPPVQQQAPQQQYAAPAPQGQDQLVAQQLGGQPIQQQPPAQGQPFPSPV